MNMTTLKKFKVGIVGFGLSGSTLHAPFILNISGFDLVGVVSSNPEKVALQLPQAQVFKSLEEMLRNIDIDLVVITTPNHTHYELTKTCLKQNKHVVVEKPFVLKVDQANELIELAKQKNIILCTYQNRRWDSAALTLKKLLSDGVLGNIYQCNIHFDRYRPTVKKIKWKELNIEGAGTLYDISPHLLDHALCFFGMPNSIQADVTTQRKNAEVTDYFHISLTYGKTKVILHSSSVVLGDVPHMQAHGDKGSYICYSMAGDEKCNLNLPVGATQNQTILRLNEGNAIRNIDLKIEATNYQPYYEQIHAAVAGIDAQPVSFADMLNNVRLMELAIESANTGQRIYL
jgi:scyllo-inositol 2-dehydrogenase (NADP+)